MGGYRAPYLESAATVCDASRDSRESSGAAMASISAPARRDGRNWPHRPESRSKYIRSLPNPRHQPNPGLRRIGVPPTAPAGRNWLAGHWLCRPAHPIATNRSPVDSPLMALPASQVPRAGLWLGGEPCTTRRRPSWRPLTSRDPAGTPVSDGNAALAAHSALPAPSGICLGGVGATGRRAGYALGFQRRLQSGTTWP